MNKERIIHVTDKEDVMKFGFVFKAMGKDSCREYMNVVKFDGERMLATDGKRANILTVSEDLKVKYKLEDGYYLPITIKAKEIMFKSVDFDLPFPNVDKIIPGDAPTKKFDVAFFKKDGNQTMGSIARIIKALSENKGLNFNHIYDLPKTIWDVEIYGALQPIRLQSTCKAMTSYTMPMELSE